MSLEALLNSECRIQDVVNRQAASIGNSAICMLHPGLSTFFECLDQTGEFFAARFELTEQCLHR